MPRPSDPRRIVLHPVLTEKSTGEQERARTYRFEVAAAANKIQIGAAVAELFGVEVDSVRTMVRPGKPRRRGWSSYHSPARKVAVVTLKEGHKIELL